MFTDEELDRHERAIGYRKYNIIDPTPDDKTMARLNKLAERARLALPRIVNMRQSGIRSLNGLKWMRRLFAPDIWREREFSRRIKVRSLDNETKEALDEAIKLLRTQISVVDLFAHAYRQARTKRMAQELETWWRLLDVADKNLGIKALQEFVDDIETYWSKADLDQRIDILIWVMWAIEEYHRTEAQTMEVVAASVAVKPATTNVA